MNVNGTANRPMRKESEKLSVARAERNIPSVRREKHLISLKCVRVKVNDMVKRVEMIGGRKTLKILNV